MHREREHSSSGGCESVARKIPQNTILFVFFTVCRVCVCMCVAAQCVPHVQCRHKISSHHSHLWQGTMMNKAGLNYSTNDNYLAEEEAEDFFLKWQTRVLTHHPVNVLSM